MPCRIAITRRVPHPVYGKMPLAERLLNALQAGNDQGGDANEVQFYLTGDSSEELIALGDGLGAGRMRAATPAAAVAYAGVASAPA